jgi:hypothetical protein
MFPMEINTAFIIKKILFKYMTNLIVKLSILNGVLFKKRRNPINLLVLLNYNI